MPNLVFSMYSSSPLLKISQELNCLHNVFPFAPEAQAIPCVQEIPGAEHAEEDETIPADQLPGNPLNHQ
jgi:hypothetical protein